VQLGQVLPAIGWGSGPRPGYKAPGIQILRGLLAFGGPARITCHYLLVETSGGLARSDESRVKVFCAHDLCEFEQLSSTAVT
jgi:hypothetical protein